MSDFRIYTYEPGSLRKLDYRFIKYHKTTSLEKAMENIKSMINTNRCKDTQFVITEYTGTYKFKIVLII